MLQVSPLPYPASCSSSLQEDGFGVIVRGVADIKSLTSDEFIMIEKLLYTHSIVCFPGSELTPAGQFALTNAFDPTSTQYGHGAVGRPEAKSILHPDLRNIPSQPAVQLIGNGPATDPAIIQGLPAPVQLKHPSHQNFHKTQVSDEDSAKGITRFYRFHIDAALYALDPPKVTTLYGLSVPQGPKQTVRYDDGTGDELQVSLGGTSFVSGRKMFEILPPALKSLAVRAKVRYAPHPYIWMAKCKAFSTGLGLESEGLEVPLDELPEWEESKVKILPMLWKNPVTGLLHLQVHPCAAQAIIISALPAGVEPTPDTLYPNGATLTDLKEVRDLLYQIQRPGITPSLVYTHDWSPKDLVLFHNRGVLHSITGAFKPEEQRAFWQCNLASSDSPKGPDEEDVNRWA